VLGQARSVRAESPPVRGVRSSAQWHDVLDSFGERLDDCPAEVSGREQGFAYDGAAQDLCSGELKMSA